MVRNFTQDEWQAIIDIVTASRKLEGELTEKGFDVINTLTMGIYPANLTFIVKRDNVEVFSKCLFIFDILKEQEDVQSEISHWREVILYKDSAVLEIQKLKARLAQLEKHYSDYGC